MSRQIEPRHRAGLLEEDVFLCSVPSDESSSRTSSSCIDECAHFLPESSESAACFYDAPSADAIACFPIHFDSAANGDKRRKNLISMPLDFRMRTHGTIEFTEPMSSPNEAASFQDTGEKPNERTMLGSHLKYYATTTIFY